MDVTLLRIIDSPARATRGILFFLDTPLWTTLEPPNKHNLPLVSCIPEGVYQCRKREKVLIGHEEPVEYPVIWEVETVAGRTRIFFHRGNYKEDTQGCILVGQGFNEVGITNSKLAYSDFMSTIQDPNKGPFSNKTKTFVLTIKFAR